MRNILNMLFVASLIVAPLPAQCFDPVLKLEATIIGNKTITASGSFELVAKIKNNSKTPQDIYLMSCSNEADNWYFDGIALAAQLNCDKNFAKKQVIEAYGYFEQSLHLKAFSHGAGRQNFKVTFIDSNSKQKLVSNEVSITLR